MTRSTTLALAAALGLAGLGSAQAQAPDFLRPSAAGASGNVVGGGHRQFVAGGTEMHIVDVEPSGGRGPLDFPTQSGRTARIDSNHGDGPQVSYGAPAPSGGGRHARMFGGGNEMVIIYGTAEELRGAVR